ncbi:hypothetical protein B9Z19DRAFT_1099240 [Tuber borchii]|uniref:WD40-repeat-containing domain protein n=1 Tax=Tuber borchii TaxID=42251 RepID=A0A2T7A3I9_TUBBO|nr:hypothetical protein B9Z19DRAFT_1099240 [Tuber borchii]
MDYSLKYSAFYDDSLAAAECANFGLVGNGRSYIPSVSPLKILCERYRDTQNSLFEFAFGDGDGSIKLFDTALERGEHTTEFFCLSWHLVDKSGFVSTSWDGNVKLEVANMLKVDMNYLPLTPHDPNQGCTYSALFSLRSAPLISTASSDSIARLFYIRTPPSSAKVYIVIRTFNLRFPNKFSLGELLGHECPGDVWIIVSYDITVRVDSDGSSNATVLGIGGIEGLSRGTNIYILSGPYTLAPHQTQPEV